MPRISLRCTDLPPVPAARQLGLAADSDRPQAEAAKARSGPERVLPSYSPCSRLRSGCINCYQSTTRTPPLLYYRREALSDNTKRTQPRLMHTIPLASLGLAESEVGPHSGQASRSDVFCSPGGIRGDICETAHDLPLGRLGHWHEAQPHHAKRAPLRLMHTIAGVPMFAKSAST